MKILWIVSSGWKEGGVENLLYVARQELESRGHTVKILSSDARPDLPHISDFEYKRPRGILRPFLYTWNPYAYAALRRVLRDYAPDVVHVHTIGHASPSILFALRGTKAYVTVHGPEAYVPSLILYCLPISDFKNAMRDKAHLKLLGWLRFAYYRYINGPLYRRGFHNIKVITTPSHYMQELVAHEYKNIFLPNGTLLFAYHPLSKNELSQTMVFAGRLESYKGVDVLLRACAEIFKKFPAARLKILGDGTERAHLEALARELELEQQVHFVGHVGRDALEAAYKDAAFAVMPSTGIEAFGLSGIEALSVGRPVVASRSGGISDWLTPDVGFLVEPGDSAALAAALQMLLGDPELIVRMMPKARARAEEFGIDAYIDKLVTLYEGARQVSE